MSRSGLGLLIILYAALMAYASTIVGPVGPHYVPIEWDEAWRRLLDMPYVDNDSGQRSDWMGNLVMTVPLGFLVSGLLSPGPLLSKREMPGAAAFAALVLCFAFIVAVKYAQLFFPPRTVTLNYVLAQSIGAVVGIVLLGVLRSALPESGPAAVRLESLRVVLLVYTALLVVFMLMPLDFALNAEDLTRQLDKVPDTFTGGIGEGRPLLVRIALIIAAIVETAPVGALLTLVNRGRVHVGRSIGASVWTGFVLMLLVYAATLFVLSGSASLPAVLFRTLGATLGAWAMHWFSQSNPDKIRYDLSRLVPWVVPVYLLIVVTVNGLLSLDWTNVDAASNDFYRLGLWPLFNYYIVSKAQAAKNIVGHAVLYAPIGVMVWLRATRGDGRARAFVLAALLSAVVEIGRFLRPGLVPDINAVPLAGIAACATAALMPLFWDMVASVAVNAGPPRLAQGGVIETPLNWRDLKAQSNRGERNKTIGDIEEY